MTGYTDEETFNGIKKFQNDNGLTADGVLKPGGETETALNERLKARESRATANNEHDSRLEDLQNSYQGKLQRKNLLSDSQQAQRSQIQRRTAETEEDTWGKLPEKANQKPLFEQEEPAVKPATSPSPSLQADNLLTSESDKIDGRMQQLHEKYRHSLVRRNLLTQPSANIVSDSFKAAIAERESGKNGYKAYNSAGGGIGALGKYQLRSSALRDAKYLDNNYNWVGKDGIKSKEDFLNSPNAQEKAADNYFNSIEKQIKNKGMYQHLNKKIKINNNNIEVTKPGLIAASHRQGAGKTNSCLNFLENNSDGSYSMNLNNLKTKNERQKCQSVLTRIREFEKY